MIYIPGETIVEEEVITIQVAGPKGQEVRTLPKHSHPVNAHTHARPSIGNGMNITDTYRPGEINMDNLTIANYQIIDESITTEKLAKSAVHTSNIADSAVTTLKMAAQAVDRLALQKGAITASKLAEASIGPCAFITILFPFAHNVHIHYL